MNLNLSEATSIRHRVKILENKNGLFEWVFFVTNYQKRPTSKSNVQYKTAWEARKEATGFAKMMSKLLQCRYIIVDNINNLPDLKIENGKLVKIVIENIPDGRKVKRNRIPKSIMSKLSEADLMAVDNLLKEGVTIKEISKTLNISPVLIYEIKFKKVIGV